MNKPLLLEVRVERNHEGTWLETLIGQHLIFTHGSDDVDALETLTDLVQEELGEQSLFHFILVEPKVVDDGQ